MTDGNPLTMPATWPEWLSLANVLLTATFAFLTFLILRANRAAVAAMRDQMADQNRPYVHVSVQVRLGTPVLQLLVRNVGRSPAENLRLHIDRDFYQFGDRSEARNRLLSPSRSTVFRRCRNCSSISAWGSRSSRRTPIL